MFFHEVFAGGHVPGALARLGRRPILNTIGGMSAWRAVGLPTTRET